MAEPTMAAPVAKPALGKAIGIGLVVSLGLAFAYSLLVTATDGSWPWAFLGMGLVIAIVVAKVARGKNATVGVVAAVLTVVAILVGICAAMVGLIAKNFDLAVFDIIGDVDYVEAVKAFFEENVIRLVVAIAAVGLAFVVGAGLQNKQLGK